MALLTLLVLAFTLLGVAVVGRDRPSQGTRAFLTGDGRVGPVVWALSLVATFLGVFTLLGATGEVYRDGRINTAFVWRSLLTGLFLAVLASAFNRRARALGAITPSDLFASHYRGSVILPGLVMLVGVAFALPAIVLQIQGASLIWNALVSSTGSSWLQILALTVSGGGLCLGGFRALARAQSLIVLLVLTTMIGLVAILIATPGVSDSLTSSVASTRLAADPTLAYPAWLFSSMVILGTVLQPAVFIRFTAPGSTGSIVRGTLVFIAVMALVLLFCVSFLGLAARSLLPPTLDSQWKVIPHVWIDSSARDFSRTLPTLIVRAVSQRLGTPGPFVSLVMLAALLSAAIGVIGSNFHALGVMTTRDIYVRIFRRTAGPREQAWVYRFGVVAAVAIVTAVQIVSLRADRLRPDLLLIELGALSVGCCLQLLPMTIDLLLIRKGTQFGAICGLLFGLATVGLFSPILGILAERFQPAYAGALAELRTHYNAPLCGLLVNGAVFLFLSIAQGMPSVMVQREIEKS